MGIAVVFFCTFADHLRLCIGLVEASCPGQWSYPYLDVLEYILLATGLGSDISPLSAVPPKLTVPQACRAVHAATSSCTVGEG